MLKVLLINTFEKSGGAAIACKSLYLALKKQNIDVNMLVQYKTTQDNLVHEAASGFLAKKQNRVRFLWERLIIFIVNVFSKTNLFEVSLANTGINISKHKLVKEADIIHLHWINQGFLSLSDIKKLTKLNKPIVWTMHDMWAFTGICHYARNCNKYKLGCNSCHLIKINCKKDLSFCRFKLKKQIFNMGNMTFVGCSKWIATLAADSAINENNLVTSIPNPIDTSVYLPVTKQSARKQLGLPEEKKLILFGAVNPADKRKGLDYLISMSNLLHKQHKHSYAIVVFGSNSDELKKLISLDVYSVGFIKDNEKKVKLYSTTDVFLIPSLEDNLPNTIMESMACGTPCVGFDVGGIPEMIDHKINGYVAEYKNSSDLLAGIEWVLENPDYLNISKNARAKVLLHYNEETVAKQYIKLYESLLS